MQNAIRRLTIQDFRLVEEMETGIEEDYVLRIFNRLLDGNNRLFGLFNKGQLVSIAGYSLYASHYAMLGRLRSDLRYRGRNFSTSLMQHMIEEVFKMERIHWVGANTQENNLAAKKVLRKAGLHSHKILYSTITQSPSKLETGAKPWKEVHTLKRKKDLIYKGYLETYSIFPYQCYYSFPASWELFTDENLLSWSFYENEKQNRFLITKEDQKKNHYLHTIYPWDDIHQQEGLWETITADYKQLTQRTGENTYVWMDLIPSEVEKLPDYHPFELPSPWILFGISRKSWQQT
ncbi:GNAT family N-acetyltransferase [Oceanobacillus jordanicus]|uniref:GNAT family N-acetyltransferase n=1 Tax=Oceanobacillus jordanicus TaxID=2867266 RepID=A0AAW5B5A8_9BACI|nr:GNAT family N-acetyltransferase [Oceanobacillus jordanicus]MCG3419210.1 GNAT family N-acetyltransferase [Oceanobacillus jordanicus]